MAKRAGSVQKRSELREARRKQEQQARTLRYAGLAVLGLVIVGALVWFFTRPAPASAMGQEVGGLSRDHITTGSDTGAYSTDPPAGGHHYPETYQAGFYDESDLPKLPKQYQGYLVHNLEHGYVIYWYNCAADPKINCDEMKNAIKKIITDNNSFKVIGFPWPSQKEPLVITSWGRILRLTTLDTQAMQQFYQLYKDKGPEQTPN